MNYTTADTEWPSAITVSEATKTLINTYFILLDTNSEEVGDRLAEEIFTSGGAIIGPLGEMKGTEAIRNSRNEAWKVLKSRRHRVLRVYGFDNDAEDLLIIGDVMQELPNGRQVSGEWIARLQFTSKLRSGEKPKIKTHQVWADFGQGQKTIQEAMNTG